MATFRVKVRVWNPAEPDRAAELESLGLSVDPVHKKLIPLVVALGLLASEK